MYKSTKVREGRVWDNYINDLYRKEKKLKAVEITWEWLDTGTFDSLLKANNFIYNKRINGN